MRALFTTGVLVVLVAIPTAALSQPLTQPIKLRAVDEDQPLKAASARSTNCVKGIGCAGDPAYELRLEEAMEHEPGYTKAKVKRVFGIILISVGSTGLLLAGLMAMGSSVSVGCPEYVECSGESDSDKAGLAIGVTVAGSLLVALAVGVPLLSSGVADNNKIRRRAQRRLGAGLRLTAGPGDAGLGLRYQF